MIFGTSNITTNDFKSLARSRETVKQKKKITQCTDMQTAIAFALIRLGKISGRRRPGTGPAPIAKVKTNLDREVLSYGTHNDIVNQNALFIIC